MTITKQRVSRLERDAQQVSGKGKILICTKLESGKYEYQGKVYDTAEQLEKDNGLEDRENHLIVIDYV